MAHCVLAKYCPRHWGHSQEKTAKSLPWQNHHISKTFQNLLKFFKHLFFFLGNLRILVFFFKIFLCEPFLKPLIFYNITSIFLCFCFLAIRHVGSLHPNQGSNPYLLHWKVKSQPLNCQGIPWIFLFEGKESLTKAMNNSSRQPGRYLIWFYVQLL